MPYSLDITIDGHDVTLCACDVIAEGLYRGVRYSDEHDKFVPVNRWLCEQCKGNLEEMYSADLKLIRRQNVSYEAFEAWENWYEVNAQ